MHPNGIFPIVQETSFKFLNAKGGYEMDMGSYETNLGNVKFKSDLYFDRWSLRSQTFYQARGKSQVFFQEEMFFDYSLFDSYFIVPKITVSVDNTSRGNDTPSWPCKYFPGVSKLSTTFPDDIATPFRPV